MSDILYLVVRNDEDQYSIWEATRPLPGGWSAIGAARPRQECLDEISRTWTDMRPASLRRAMASTELPR